ncbi:hypothetical protein QJS10_CPA03g00323 [Acorus calamus]|uniref:Uncharacterized protein n=1 Tax=Acorus calamus TaxID=4465 RepID=A0AAV9F820_ACOCL|nr:hypothetical protein QJS10_CPA03g00323 [Acorus calamus]
MPQRGYILVFVFWALLTLITPTLIFWSASARPSLATQEIKERNNTEIKGRRMMGSSMRDGSQRNSSAPAPAPAPGPAPAPAPWRPKR